MSVCVCVCVFVCVCVCALNSVCESGRLVSELVCLPLFVCEKERVGVSVFVS